MNIHEYQGKQIFAKHGIPVPKGIPVFKAEDAKAAAEKLMAETGIPVVVVKAQIHAGGRGKGGGVKVVKGGPSEVESVAGKLLGMNLVTHQTGPEGQKVRRLYVEQGLDIARESRTEAYEPLIVYDPILRTSRLLAPARTEGPTHRTVVRPFGEIGFKAYMTRRSFFTTDMRLMARGGIDEVLFRLGFGMDF